MNFTGYPGTIKLLKMMWSSENFRFHHIPRNSEHICLINTGILNNGEHNGNKLIKSEVTKK